VAYTAALNFSYGTSIDGVADLFHGAAADGLSPSLGAMGKDDFFPPLGPSLHATHRADWSCPVFEKKGK
jgi:hypothetical protein